MPKILDINNMLDAATTHEMPGLREHVERLEGAAGELAMALASHLNIVADNPEYQTGFGGLCVNFYAATPGQKCPDGIAEGDIGGEWETQG